MSDIILVAVFFIADGLLLVALGVPLLQGQVPPNAGYGFWTKKSFSDEKIWYAVNRVAGKDMVLAGVIVIVSSLLLLPFGGRLGFMAAVVTLLAVTVVMVAWMVIHGYHVPSPFLTFRRSHL